jgi:hypothetical protein
MTIKFAYVNPADSLKAEKLRELFDLTVILVEHVAPGVALLSEAQVPEFSTVKLK